MKIVVRITILLSLCIRESLFVDLFFWSVCNLISLLIRITILTTNVLLVKICSKGAKYCIVDFIHIFVCLKVTENMQNKHNSN